MMESRIQNTRACLQGIGGKPALILLFLLLSISEMAYGQATPGDARPGDVRLWYRADSINCGTNGCNVTAWGTCRTNGSPFTTLASGTGCEVQRPVFNYRPAVVSNSNNDFLTFGRPASSDMGFCLVFATTSTGTGPQWYNQPAIFSGENTAPGNLDYGLTINNGTVNWSHTNTDGVGCSSTTTYNNGLPFIIYCDRDESSTTGRLFINGVQQGGNNTNWQAGNLNGSTNLDFFQHPGGAGDLQGSLPEFVAWDKTLDGNRRARIFTYMALRYGITLGIDYVDDQNNTIFPISGAYVNNVAGIGLESVCRLDQRQSISSNPEGIVAIGNGPTIFAEHNLNTTPFTANGAYLIWGDDAGASCFSSEIKIPGAERLHYKIDRTWKMVRTGASGHVDVTVQLNTTDVDFMLPALPPNADGNWYMYLHTTSDFNTGTPIAKQMTSLGGGLWRVTMTPAETNLYGFFSFGCRLNSSVLNLSYCTGDTLTLTGSYLALPNSCAVVQFDGPSVLNLIEGATLSDSTFTVVSNGAGECLDVIRCSITVPSGSYDINVERDATAASCGTIPTPTPTSIPRVEKQQITVSSGAPVLAGFDASYGSDTAYACVGENNIDFFTNIVNPIINVNSSTGLTVSQLITTGPDQVLVYSGAVGRHQILISSLASCGVETLDVVIKAATPSTFSYQYDPACLGTVDSIASVSPAGGYFELTAPASGIIVDSLTGAVTTSGGTSGIYLITYLNTDTTCFTPSVVNLNVPPPDEQVFNYTGGPYCTNSPDLLPSISSYSHYNTGYFVFDSSASGETITVDSTTGAVLFSTASGPDVFTIRYENSSAVTACGLSTWADVTVISPTPFTFNYSNDTLCAGTGFATPTIPLGLSNYEWFYDTTQIDLNPITGAINTNTSSIGGPYTLSLEADGAGCRTRSTITVWINGLPGNSVSYPNNYYCETDPSPLPLFLSGTAGGTFSSTTGLVFTNVNTGQVNLATSPKNVFHQVFYTPNNSTCPTTVLIEDSLFIVLRPDASFTIDSAVCRSVGTITANATNPNTGGYNIYQGPTLVLANFSTDVIPLALLPQDGSYRLQKVLNTQGACLDTAVNYFQILPLENANFNYSPLIACENTQYVDPFIFGNGGGTFSVDTTYNLTTIVDQVTGRLDLDSSGSGWHGIIYTTNGPCPSSQLDTIRILRGFSSYFSLALSVVCESLDSIEMETVFETTLGNAHFFSVPAGLLIHPRTGTIFPNGSAVSGLTSYEVFHVTGGTGFCPDTTKSTFRILEYDDNFAIDFGTGPFCTGAGVLVPTVTVLDTSNIRFNQPVGLTYADTTALGAVDLRYTRQGNYEIRMQKNTECAEIARDSLIVLQSDVVNFSYGLLGVCESNAIITPTLSTSGGLFSVVPIDPRDTIVLDPVSGALNVGLSEVGFYDITYATTGICPGSLTQTVAINANPIITDVEAAPGFSFCAGDTLEITAEGSGGSYSWFVQRGNLPQIPYGTGAVLRRSDFQLNDTLWLKISSPTTGCSDSVYNVMEALAKPLVSVVDTPLLLSGSAPFEVTLGVSQDGSVISWYQVASSGDLAQDSAITDVLTINDVAAISNSLEFDSDYDPVTVTMYFQAVKNGCRGETDSLVFIVNPSNLPIFIPEVMTPNGDGPNDVWEIRYNQNINPNNYTIEVYNRSGAKVYTLPNLDDRWGGSGNPDGVYWWMLRDQSGVVQQHGGLTIRRQ